jgi:hypothetical protein
VIIYTLKVRINPEDFNKDKTHTWMQELQAKAEEHGKVVDWSLRGDLSDREEGANQ